MFTMRLEVKTVAAIAAFAAAAALGIAGLRLLRRKKPLNTALLIDEARATSDATDSPPAAATQIERSSSDGLLCAAGERECVSPGACSLSELLSAAGARTNRKTAPNFLQLMMPMLTIRAEPKKDLDDREELLIVAVGESTDSVTGRTCLHEQPEGVSEGKVPDDDSSLKSTPDGAKVGADSKLMNSEHDLEADAGKSISAQDSPSCPSAADLGELPSTVSADASSPSGSGPPKSSGDLPCDEGEPQLVSPDELSLSEHPSHTVATTDQDTTPDSLQLATPMLTSRAEPRDVQDDGKELLIHAVGENNDSVTGRRTCLHEQPEGVSEGDVPDGDSPLKSTPVGADVGADSELTNSEHRHEKEAGKSVSSQNSPSDPFTADLGEAPPTVSADASLQGSQPPTSSAASKQHVLSATAPPFYPGASLPDSRPPKSPAASKKHVLSATAPPFCPSQHPTNCAKPILSPHAVPFYPSSRAWDRQAA